jgi:hypothetical protein
MSSQPVRAKPATISSNRSRRWIRVMLPVAAAAATSSQRARPALDSTVASALHRIGRRIGHGGGQIGRIGRHVLERAEAARQWSGKIVLDRTHRSEVRSGPNCAGQSTSDGCNSMPTTWTPDAPGQAQAHGGHARTQIEDALARLDGMAAARSTASTATR